MESDACRRLSSFVKAGKPFSNTSDAASKIGMQIVGLSRSAQMHHGTKQNPLNNSTVGASSRNQKQAYFQTF